MRHDRTTHPARPAVAISVLAVMLTALIGPLLPGTAVADPVRQSATLPVAAANTVLDQFDQQMLT